MKLNTTNALLLAGAAVLGYTLVSQNKEQLVDLFNLEPGMDPTIPSSPVPYTPSSGSSPAPKKPTVSSSPWPMEKGSRGENVKILQRHLGVGADGVFGAQTESALLQRHGVSKIYSADGFQRVLSNQIKVPIIPASPTLPTTPTTPAKPNWVELDPVFRAFYDQVSMGAGRMGFRLKLIADKATLERVLGAKSDSALKVFIQQYNRAYAKATILNKQRVPAGLAFDFSQLTIVGGSSLAILRDRIKRLS